MKHLSANDVVRIDDTATGGLGGVFDVWLISPLGTGGRRLSRHLTKPGAELTATNLRAIIADVIEESEANGRNNFAEYLNGVRS